VSGKRVTRQSDVYSASVVLWESLVLRRLFDRENEAAVISGILDSNIDPPSSLSPDVPKAYDEVVLKGLSKNPADRYGTALDMARALEACGRVAAPAEVGEWMERVAPDHLRSRNEQVAEVESTSQLRAVEAIDAQRLLGSAPRIVEQASSSQISSVSVSSTGASPRRGGRWLGAIGVLAVLGGGFAIYYVTRAPRPETPSAPLVTGASSASASTTVVTDAAPAVADVGPDAPASAIAAKSSAKPKLPVPVGAKTQPVAPVATPETKPETPKPAADCDPPYTIDAKGNKQWKMHCL